MDPFPTKKVDVGAMKKTAALMGLPPTLSWRGAVL